MVRAGKRRRKGERMVRKQTKVAPHPPRGSRRASPSPRSAGRGKEAAERAETDAHREINFDPQSETLDAEYQAWWQQAKSLPGPERRPTYLKFQAAFDARQREERRVLNNAFRFWFACPHKACKRTSRCMSDPHACFEHWWPAVPESMKALFRFYILAGKEGLSQPDAARKAQAQVEQHAEQIAQLEAEQTRMLAARDAEERQRD